MSKKLVISLSIITAITILSFWAFFVSKNMTKNVVKQDEVQSISDENLNVKEMVLTESKDGKKYWELYAVSGEYDSATNQVHLKNVKGNFYKNDKVVLSFDSPFATYYDRDKDVKLSGGARAATENKILVTAREIYWKGKNDEISAKGNVKIRRETGLLVTGECAVFSTKLSRIKMIGKVTTRLLKSSKGIK